VKEQRSVLDDIDPVVLGVRLSMARLCAGRTIYEAAQATQIDYDVITSIEMGAAKPSAGALIELARYYHVQISYLINGPSPYQTPEQILDALSHCKISEMTAARLLGVDLLDLRTIMEEKGVTIECPEDDNR